ncbi:MAG: hypothetical protein OEZ22_05780 [Spirochaetia bacterium]|nr:hypothetical protein [Spirochaetia bacterium]
MRKKIIIMAAFISLVLTACSEEKKPMNLGTKVFVIERASESMAVIDYKTMELVSRISLSGNLRHASMVFDPELHYGFIATRNGVLTRVNLETMKEDGYIQTSKNSIGLGISQDGRTIAVSEYEPGGITFVDTETFTVTNRISGDIENETTLSRVTGLVDGANNTFLCALMDNDEIWELMPETNNKTGPVPYKIKRKIKAVASFPFDALISPEGRYYVTGHFKSEKISLVDLWENNPAAKPVHFKDAKEVDRIPVKMPHMEAWAVAGNKIFIPLPGKKRLAVISSIDYKFQKYIELAGDPVYAVVHPNQKEIWISFSGEKDDGKVEIIDTITEKSIEVINFGKKIFHMVFTPRGDKAFISSNMTNEFIIVNALTREELKRIPLKSPSGIFGIWRAFQTGL